MKKYVICLMAAGLGIAASAFTTPKKVKPQSGTYQWYDFNGNLLQQWDPTYYSLDGNQYPDCPCMLGLIYCEIKALPMEEDPSLPDLTTIIGSRFRPLL